MSKGKVVQQSDGSFGVTNNANVIGNEDTSTTELSGVQLTEAYGLLIYLT